MTKSIFKKEVNELIKAALRFEYSNFQKLAKVGDDIDKKYQDGTSILHIIAHRGDSLLMMLAIKEMRKDALTIDPEKINAQNSQGDTPLHIACKSGKDGVAMILIYEGANTSITNLQGHKAIDCISAQNPQKDRLIELEQEPISHQILINKILTKRLGIALQAIFLMMEQSKNYQEKTKIILEELVADVFSELTAISKSKIEKNDLQNLIKGCLMVASDISKMGSESDLTDQNAICQKYVKYLINNLIPEMEYGDYDKERTQERALALIKKTILQGREEPYLLMLLREQDDLKIFYENNETLLHLLVKSKFTISLILVAQKLRKGIGAIDPEILNAQDKDGNTALHLALEIGPENISAPLILIYEGADYQICNFKGETAEKILDSKQPRFKEEIKNHLELKITVNDVRTAIFRFGSIFNAKYIDSKIFDPFSQTINQCCETAKQELLQLLKNKTAPNVEDTSPTDYAMRWCLKDRILVPQKVQSLDELALLMQELVKEGADVATSSRQGNTAAHFAGYLKSQPLMDELIARNAKLDMLNFNFKTPRFFATTPTINGRKFLQIPEPIKSSEEAASLQSAPAPIAEISAPTLSAKQLWAKHLTDLQKIADGSSSTTASSAAIKDLAKIIASKDTSDEVDFNLKFAENYTPLMILTKLDYADLAKQLIAKEVEVNARNNKKDSALSLSFANSNFDLSRAILSAKNLQFQTLCDDLKKGIVLKDFKFANKLLEIPELVNPLAQGLAGGGDKNLMKALRDLAQTKFKANAKAVGVEITKLENAVNSRVKELVPKKSKQAAQKILPQEAEEIKEQKAKIRAENLEKEEAERKKIEQEKKEKSAQNFELSQMRKEERASKITEEISRQEKVRIESEKKEVSPQNLQFNSVLSSEATEFQPSAELLLKIKKEKERKQIKDFLKTPRHEIKLIEDLPKFLQPIFRKLIDGGHQVLLKGSVVYQGINNAREPSDLDIEIVLNPKVNVFKKSEIQNFLEENFGPEIGSANTYLEQKNGSNSIFTANLKDKNFDLSLYQEKYLPPKELSWTNSKEEKILFLPDGSAKRQRSQGFEEYLHDNNLNFDPEKDFLINPKARGLILRLCFLKTIGEISEEQIKKALPAILPQLAKLKIPSLKFLLIKELKSSDAAAQNKKIEELALSHSLNLQDFVANLNWIISEEMEAEIRSQKKNPAAAPTTFSASSVVVNPFICNRNFS